MKTLILTEKPSVAMDFAKALGVAKRHDGFLESHEYIITWAVGHLVELLEPQDYDAKWKKWSLDSLPIIPSSFQYKPIARTKKQWSIIRSLLKNNPVERVVVATDAGREGEVIARTILLTAGFKETDRLYRFWSSLALTPQVIQEGMRSTRPLSEYDRLWKAGQSRQMADWLVGMNISRAATVTLRDLFSVGRVQTAVLALLVDRRRERDAFKPEPYWLLVVHFSNEKGNWLGTWFRDKQIRFDKKEDAEGILNKIIHQTGKVISVKKQKKRQPPPLLYSLTDLQQDANKLFGFSAQTTLDLAQKLYEKYKCLSYPRTDAKVLGSKNVGLVQHLVEKLSQCYTQLFTGIVNELIHESNKRVFNDAKLTDHHALIPLAPIPTDASEAERKLYFLVVKRFAAVFCADCEYEQTEIITGVEDETFRTRGKTILKPGWRMVYGVEGEQQDPQEDEPDQENLPPLEKDDPARVDDAQVKEKKTSPPPEYTEATLLKDMTNPGKYVSEDELKKIFRGEVGLGTQATRAQIIETLLKRQYVERKKKNLMATEKGCFLIDTLRRFKELSKITSADETARWEMQLERIAMGQGDAERFMAEIQQFVLASLREMKSGPVRQKQPVELGVCPHCGGRMIEGKRGFGCSNWKQELGGCSFVIWKTISGRTITPSMVHNLLIHKTIGPIDSFLTESYQLFSAMIALVQGSEGWTVELRKVEASSSQTDNEKTLGRCPDCGGEIVEVEKGYGCKNWKDADGGCKFMIWKTIAHKKIPKKAIVQLLRKGTTDLIIGFKSKEGKPFSSRLKLSKTDSGPSKVVFDFAAARE